MNKKDFLDQLGTDSTVITEIDKMILGADCNVIVSVGKLMNIKSALLYQESGVFKYGLTRTNNYFSYHSMVMYVYPELLIELKNACPKVKFQKGCFNFKSIDDIDVDAFKDFLRKSAQANFAPVIKHYMKKQ